MFSCVGCLLLCVLTAGILSFWVGPRIQAAKYAFYLNILGKSESQAEAEVQVEIAE